MEEFNSADIEVDETAPRFPNAGKASLQSYVSDTSEEIIRLTLCSILVSACRDRAESKQAQKTLQDTAGSESTQYSHQLWFTRLQAFRKDTLKLE